MKLDLVEIERKKYSIPGDPEICPEEQFVIYLDLIPENQGDRIILKQMKENNLLNSANYLGDKITRGGIRLRYQSQPLK